MTTTPTQAQPTARLVRYWMSTPAITISFDAWVSDALARMHEHSVRRLPVVDADNQLCGIITDGDIRGADLMRVAGIELGTIADALRTTQVQDMMTPDPIRLTPTMTIREAALLMLDNKVGGLPVVDADNTVIGVITESDLFEALVCYLDLAAENVARE
jgi:CBS domain-containing protein